MHDVAVALDHHDLVEDLGAEAGHPTYVVTGEIDEHDVLGHFLRVLDQLSFESGVFLWGDASGTGPGDGPRRHRAVAEAHHRLGRRAHDGHLGEAQEVQVRARIDQTQYPIHIERVGPKIAEVEPLGQDHLEDIAG